VRQTALPRIGISAISTYEPPWSLPNAWFEGISRKFVHHTGIEARPISLDDEVAMAVKGVKNLQRETHCDLRQCAAMVFVSPSFVPMAVARKHLDGRHIRREGLRRAGRQLVRRLGIADCPLHAINWFCSGYAKAMSIVRRRVLPAADLKSNQFILVVTSSRISRITDFACKQTGPLFGDMATATLLARTDSHRYPVHFELVSASAQKQPAAGVFFDFHLRENVLAPSPDGAGQYASQRLVFSLDGSGIADIAPRAMAAAVDKALRAKKLAPQDVRFVVPHQAGSAIVRFAAMKLESLGIRGEVINGMTNRVGNVSSCSIPYALKQAWNRLEGLIACPTAAVGTPGKPEVSQGCILLRSTPMHQSTAKAA